MIPTKTYLIIAFAVFISFAFTPSREQGIATIDQNYCILLDGETMHNQYVIDISGLAFTTEKEANRVFGSIMSNLRDFEQLDLTAQTVVMNVHTDRAGPTTWSKEKWDTYFNTYCN